MEKQALSPSGAPQAVGGYSHMVALDKMLYSSGQIGLDPSSNRLVPGGIEEQAKRTMENIKFLLEGNNSSLEHVVKMNLYLVDMGDFAIVNDIYKSYFSGPFPARSTVAVKALPLGALIEIDFIAHSR